LFTNKAENEELGLSYVFKSLTDTQKDIIKLVAKAHLDNPDDKGIKMKDLFAICVDEMLLHN
jgi:hypothetical protein